MSTSDSPPSSHKPAATDITPESDPPPSLPPSLHLFPPLGPNAYKPPPTSPAPSSSSAVPNTSIPRYGPSSPSRFPGYNPYNNDMFGNLSMASSTLASEVDPYEILRHTSEINPASQTDMPEKCLTFCSQRANAPPLCRMFCLRRRPPVLDRQEQLARLRPPSRQSRQLSDSSTSPSTSPSTSTSTATTASSSSSSSSSSWSPFDALRRKVEPYSFIYVRGSPDGVVGRYMEEMDFDDGQHDFKDISRGGGHVNRNKDQAKMQWLEWGEHGSLLYFPLTSLFSPILSLPNTIHRLFAPSINLFSLYRQSWDDGAQSRAFAKFTEEVQKGGALEMLGKVRGHWKARVKQRDEQLERERMDKVGKETQSKGE